MNQNGKKWKGRKSMRATKENNVITIEFEEHDTLQSPMLYQYDTGQKIKFVDVPDGVEVQFSNENSETTDNRILVDGQVEIPDFLISEGLEITAYIQYINEQSETTTKVLTIPIECRTKQQDIVPDEDKGAFRRQIEQIMNDTKKAAEEAADKVESNKEFLDKAEKASEASENSANKAKEYLNAAEQNKSEVEKLTEQCGKYSESAGSSATSASESASSASASASSASQSASNAASSATNASESATKATESEKNAKASEESVKKSESNVNQAVAEFEQKRVDSIAEITKTTTNSKKEISDLTEEKKTELNNLNDDITVNANSLKEAIVNAADTKKEEINQKGLEVLQSIPEDMGKIQDTTLIKSTESGTEINLTDSSDMNIQELHLFGKSEQKTTKGIQLLDLSSMKSGTGDGLTYTNRGDGSVQVSGTATSQVGNIWFKGKYDTNSEKLTTLLTLEAGKKYYIKDCILFEGVTNINTQTEVIEVSAEEYPEGRRITGIRNPRQVVGKTYNEVIYPLIAESSTAVDWEPYTGGQPSPSPDYPQGIESVENPTVKIVGKNKMKTYVYSSADYRGGVLIFNEYLMKGDTYYTLSADFGNSSYYVNENIETAKKMTTLTGKTSITFKTVKNIPLTATGRVPLLKRGAASKEIPQKLMLVEGKTAEEYEEYMEQTAQVTYELNGIDDIKDKLIVRADGTGTLIQRIYRIKNYIFPLSSAGKDDTAQKTVLYYSRIVGAPIALATNFEQERVMCNKLRWAQYNIWGNTVNDKPYLIEIYSTSESLPPQMVIRVPKDIDVEEFVDSGLDIQYKIKEPIVNELSADEVQKILALHTNKPNTTIWNDQNAEMQITYVADTKTYIDNKMSELQALLLEKGE